MIKKFKTSAHALAFANSILFVNTYYLHVFFDDKFLDIVWVGNQY